MIWNLQNVVIVNFTNVTLKNIRVMTAYIVAE